MRISGKEIPLLHTKSGHMILDAKIHELQDLKSIVAQECHCQKSIILKNPQLLSISDLQVLAKDSKDLMMFDFLDIKRPKI